MFTNCANNPIYIPNGGECDDCSQLESRVDNLEEAMTEVQEELPDKQDKLTAGEGIFITPDGIISTTSSMTRVTITGTDPYYSSDMTFSEILSAYNNGNAIVANYNGQMLTLQSIDGSEAVFASTDDNGSITFFTITNGNTISSSVMTVGEMVGATATADGEGGTVPAPEAGDEEKFLKGDGTWAEVSGGCCAEEVSGNPIILTDAKNMNAQSLEVDFEPIQDLNGYDYAWAGGNGKNKLNNTIDSRTTNGVTFTVNADGTVTANGTATSGGAQVRITFDGLSGDFKYCGCPRGGDSQTYWVFAWDLTSNDYFKKWDGTTRVSYDYGDMSLQEVQIPSGHSGAISLCIAGGYTANNLVFKPMIVNADVTDNTFEPYENICPISGAESVTVKVTGKNMLGHSTTSRTINGVTFTVNSDGSISTSGTATATADFWLTLEAPNNLGALENTVLSGCPSNGAPEKYTILLFEYNAAGSRIGFSRDTGGGASVSKIAGVVRYAVDINIYSGQNANGLVFRPMIRPASISDDTYEPYNSQTVSINLGGEYYGGTLDFTTGELDVEWKKYTFVGDAYTETWWTEGYSGTRPDWPLYHSIRIPNLDTSTAPYCESFGTMVGVPSSTDLGFIGVRTTGDYPTLYVRTPEDYVSINDWLAYLQANPITVVVKLATPITVNLVSSQLELLEKYNVLTTNGELITLGYMPDCYCGVTKASQLLGLTHIMDGKANGSLRSSTAFPDGVIERGGQSIDGTLGDFATALGAETMATGMGAFAHGMMTMASGTCAHAEGAGTAATGGGSHAEGEQTAASGARSHAEGLSNTASGSESHVGGALSEASGAGAFAHGQGLKASSPLQTVFGKYNVEDTNSEYAFIIGNGTSNNRSNLFAIKWDGTVEINGQALLPANGNSF